ncbi:cytochrome P450 [Allokutzneria sp. A3M-2-11 16]|uniref:cytochrome P450 n=1 Tax=Allokutzneria sp. A3M-2-11 16 TaxID=2962043 RepID=UPI0020B772A4|nr:cytochrome P450 [Allokutzneria sp. A3M-2-11 16]MCP3797691.1 cytochrome P450 [Allokutzneria sp. A3M-2-11 16]
MEPWKALRLGAARTMLRAVALTGDPVARLLGTRRLADPFPELERLRTAGPVVRSPAGVYATASHRLCAAILRSPSFRMLPDGKLAGVDWTRGPEDHLDIAHPIDHSLLSLNAPEHGLLRKHVAASFTPRAVRKRLAGIEKVVAEFLDAAEVRGEFDVIQDFAVRVPVRVICEMLGIPDSEHERFIRWGRTIGDTIEGVRTMGERRQVRDNMIDMGRFFDELIAVRRQALGEDVLSDLLRGSLGRREVIATAGLVLGAGFETTVNVIGNGVLALLAHPEHKRTLVERPGFAADVVEEVLRWNGPIQLTARAPEIDVAVEGVEIPAGSTMALMLAGANRDPEVFAAPEVFDPYRPNNREHLGFGAGAHYCLGAGLGRIEIEVALRELFTRFPGLRLNGPLVRNTSRAIHGMSSIPVAVS